MSTYKTASDVTGPSPSGRIDTPCENPDQSNTIDSIPGYETDYPADPDFLLRTGFMNPMCEAAMPLFGLALRLETLDGHQDVEELHRRVRMRVSEIIDQMEEKRCYDQVVLSIYSYALCQYIDETVMKTAWGRNSMWIQYPLLSIFHNDTLAGKKIFTLIARMREDSKRFQDVLEFIYLCFCMGLKGKYGIVSNGDEAIQKLIVELHDVIRELRGPLPEHIGNPLANVAPHNFRMRHIWPWWSPLVVSALAMSVMYSIYSYQLHLITTEVLESLNSILQQ